jgi:hypothetical protein
LRKEGRPRVPNRRRQQQPPATSRSPATRPSACSYRQFVTLQPGTLGIRTSLDTGSTSTLHCIQPLAGLICESAHCYCVSFTAIYTAISRSRYPGIRRTRYTGISTSLYTAITRSRSRNTNTNISRRAGRIH